MIRAQLLFFASLYIGSAHRPLLDAPSCAPQFSSPMNALHVPDISISWAMNAVQKCDAKVNALWLSWTAVQANMSIYIGVGVPTMKRFELIRSDYLVVGPGLPPLSDEHKAQIPEDILAQVAEIPHSKNFGYWFNRAPDDQSTCDHLCDEMKKHTSVRLGRCDFYEPFTDTHSWRLVEGDEVYGPNVGATYYVAAWLRPYTSGKFGVAIGTWTEDFFTKYDLDKAEVCDAATKDYDEKNTLAKDDPVQYEVCKAPAQPLPWTATWEGPDECGTCGTRTCGCDKKDVQGDCKSGEVTAHIIGSEAYGAAEGQCTQMCTKNYLLQYMEGASKGGCADSGYATMVEKKEVTPPDSPQPVSVTIMGKGAASPPSCKTGEVNAYLVGNADYGAAEGQCVQMCTMKSMLQWMEGASEGTCADQGYAAMVEQKEVTPPGSPMAVSVTVMEKGDSGSDTFGSASGSGNTTVTSASGDAAVSIATTPKLLVASFTLLAAVVQ
jgi:hypothetical protein